MARTVPLRLGLSAVISRIEHAAYLVPHDRL